jgi:hypothetical protein
MFKYIWFELKNLDLNSKTFFHFSPWPKLILGPIAPGSPAYYPFSFLVSSWPNPLSSTWPTQLFCPPSPSHFSSSLGQKQCRHWSWSHQRRHVASSHLLRPSTPAKRRHRPTTSPDPRFPLLPISLSSRNNSHQGLSAELPPTSRLPPPPALQMGLRAPLCLTSPIAAVILASLWPKRCHIKHEPPSSFPLIIGRVTLLCRLMQPMVRTATTPSPFSCTRGDV